MEKLIFKGSQPIRTESLNLIPGELYSVSDLSNDYLRSLKDQGLFDVQKPDTDEATVKSEESATAPELKADESATGKSKPKNPKQ